jgi:addiction module HigA family antidote
MNAMMNPPHPGEVLREDVLVEIGLTVSEAAAHLGVSRVSLSRVLNGHAGISPTLALRLEAAGVSTARAWLAMQTAHDLAVAQVSPLGPIRELIPA